MKELVNSVDSFENTLAKTNKCIVHYDYSDKNILFSPEGKIQALLDFDDSVYDHTLLDLGNLALHWAVVNHRVSKERLKVILSNYTPKISKDFLLTSLKFVLVERILDLCQRAQKSEFEKLCTFSLYAQKLFNLYEQN